uniref:Uncharacterized protein ycf33 n=1 Tax=Helminthocladia australis TaxID=260093 RepID=A0A1G4NTS0_9FLOR|nr:Hypothetical protein ycf33 [Helminthocladia australis]SCW22037.1 Hypothetical protein ycf33 [Helminthocladia australis]
MNTFWENIWKFPKFIFSVFVGFFLTAAYPIFQLSKNPKILYFVIISLGLISGFLYITFKFMLGYT